MDKNVFISGCEILSAGNYSKVVLSLFNQKNEQTTFSTSLMSKYNAEKYEQQALSLLNNKDWFAVKYGTIFPQLTLLTDSDNAKIIVGLSTPGGILLKNEVKFSAKEKSL